ncbi:MAG: DUF815 domain-containing protein [Bacillota bacterium]
MSSWELDLVLYHRWTELQAGRAMHGFLWSLAAGEGVRPAYLNLVRTLYGGGPVDGPTGDVWQNQLIRHVLLDENAFTQDSETPALLEAARHDLRQLQALFRMTGESCREQAGGGALPTWVGWAPEQAESFAPPAYLAMARRLAEAEDWAELAPDLAAYHRRHGSGVVSQSWFLHWDGAQLTAVPDPDLIELDDLVGLADQKRALLENTAPFVQGAPTNNLLLYGPRGTGKSSLVRSLALRFGGDGLRLVEVGRQHLSSIGELFGKLKGYRQRFIIFLDDLAFDADDTEYRAFKSSMEGALERRPANVALYATTNRRHMIPEQWSDRNTPVVAEVHGQDAMEEKLSLADRFGKTILFLRPNQEEYLAIVEGLAARRNLPISGAELRQAALRWALWQNVPSGRAARQFVDDLAARLVSGGPA